MKKAKKIGLPAYEAELNEKVWMLEKLLETYNDGRKKSYYCLAVNLLEISDIKSVMAKINEEAGKETTVKEKAAIATRLFNEIAEIRGVLLKLRK